MTAYLEIRYVLEANLMRRFVSTPEFRQAEARASGELSQWREVRV